MVLLKRADIILLLISADFIASDYCYEIELQQAMERHQAGEARVIPIILRPADWQNTPFSELQAFPTNAKPITSWSDRDEAWLNVEMLLEKRFKILGLSGIGERLIRGPVFYNEAGCEPFTHARFKTRCYLNAVA
ncbi:MAG: TIR domain-containing protein [Cyanobacteria bacterium P01_C01_bin.118]